MAKAKANYVPNKNIKSITVKRGNKTTEIDGKNLLDGAYVKKGVKFKRGGDSQDYYEQLAVYVQDVGSIYRGTSMKKAIEKANSYMSKNANAEIVIVDEKYGDEYDLSGNLQEEGYAKGGSMYRSGGVAGSKRVDVAKGYRLEHGYKAVKGADKTKNYSKGKPKVKVDTGYRLPSEYEVREGAYNMKYEEGGNMSSCWCYDIGGL